LANNWNSINLSNIAPQKSISISGQNATPWNTSLGSLTLNTLLGTQHGEHVKKYEVLEIDEDLLTLSTTWKRLRDIHTSGGAYVSVSTVLDKVLFNYVTTEDRNKAAEIRDYYSKKIMMWKLKDVRLSQFREDMNSFIHTNGKMFKDNIVPLAYRLPEFHSYDIEFDKLVSEHNKIITDKSNKQTKNLLLKKTFSVGKKYTKRKEYWFSDETNNLVTFSLTHDNPLISLLDNQCKNPIALSGLYNIRHRDNNQYFLLEKYSFL
jgi:hypothetical protein